MPGVLGGLVRGFCSNSYSLDFIQENITGPIFFRSVKIKRATPKCTSPIWTLREGAHANKAGTITLVFWSVTQTMHNSLQNYF